MADLTETLADLGRCEASFEELGRVRAQLPKTIAGIEARAEAARQKIAAQAAAVDAARHEHREQEGRLRDLEAQRTKFQAQAPMVKTNTEYTALLQQIDGATDKISEIETRILEAMERIDAESAMLKQIEAEQSEIESGLKREIGALQSRLAEVETEIVERERQRDELISVLPSDARSRYERVRKVSGGGTSLIVGRSCARCHRDVPYEVINRVIGGEIHTCGNCARILVKVDD